MEIVRTQNANAIAEFYPVEVFRKVDIFEIFSEKLKFLNFEKIQGIMLLLYEFSRGNQVDGSPRVAIFARAALWLPGFRTTAGDWQSAPL